MQANDPLSICPICQRKPRQHKVGMLYGRWVCKDCQADLHVRRVLAYLIDMMLGFILVSFVLSIYHLLELRAIGDITFLDVIAVPIMLAMFMIVADVYVLVLLFSHQARYFLNDFMVVVLICRYVLLPMMLVVRDVLRGMSPGKFLLGLQVIDTASSKPIGMVQSIKRHLWVFVPFMSVLLFWKIRAGFRMGDRWAHTMVVFRKSTFKTFFMNTHICTNCNYDLTGNATGQCPECGRVISSTSHV